MTENEIGTEKKGFLSFLGSKAGKIVLTCIFAAIFLLIVALICDSSNGILLLIMAVPCTYFGLQVTAKIPNFLARFPLGDWWFLMFKILLSIAIGIFVGPFVLGKKVSDRIAQYARSANK